MVTTEELEILVKSHGWRLEWSKRFATRYAYAAKGSKPNVIRHYLCGEHGLAEMSEEAKAKIVQKLR